MPTKFTKTKDDGVFLRKLGNTDEHCDKVYMVFMSDHGKHLLSTYSAWSGDGTFSTTPFMFKQVNFLPLKSIL